MNAAPKAAHTWEREPDNWYVEPEWVTEELCRAESFTGRTVDPCAGMGNTIKGAAAAGVTIEGHDLRDRGYPGIWGGRDFLRGKYLPGAWPVDNIISNSPYGRNPGACGDERPRLEEEFIRLALQRARSKVAVFLLSSWMNGAKRGEWLETLPLYRVHLVGPRPSCPPGQIIEAGEKPGGGKGDYAWFVFLNGYHGAPSIKWIRRQE